MSRPNTGDYSPFYQTYIDQVEGPDPQLCLAGSLPALEAFLKKIPADKAGYAYAAGKWTIAQVVQHMIDAERVFSYRAMCIARGEQQPLPGFDENAFAAMADAAHRTWISLVDEMLLVRRSSIALFDSMLLADFEKSGTASGKSITVNAIAFIVVGHSNHHLRIFTERYL